MGCVRIDVRVGGWKEEPNPMIAHSQKFSFFVADGLRALNARDMNYI